MSKFKVGTRIKIIKCGTLGCNGHTGTVTDKESTNGCYQTVNGFNVELDENFWDYSVGKEVWHVLYDGQYEILEEIKPDYSKENNMKISEGDSVKVVGFPEHQANGLVGKVHAIVEIEGEEEYVVNFRGITAFFVFCKRVLQKVEKIIIYGQTVEFDKGFINVGCHKNISNDIVRKIAANLVD